MIFSQQKTIVIEDVFEEIRETSQQIEQLGINIQYDGKARQYFEDVQLNQEEIATNLINHSNIIRNIERKLKSREYKINLKTVDQLLSYLKGWFRSYKEEQINLSQVQKVIKVLQIEGKLKCLEEFMVPALTYQNDIAAFPLGSKSEYVLAYQNIEVIQCPDALQTREHYETFRKLITITNAAVLTELRQSNGFLGVMSFGLSFPRFWIDYKQAQLRNYAFLRNPELNKLVGIWNLPQNGAISGLKHIQYPCINTNQLIYIPMDENAYETADIFTPSDRSIPVRVLSDKPIIFWQKEKKRCSICLSSANQLFDQIIIHAHGGGFVALSSSTMQNYTRLWSKNLDVPVFSIDYRKPPNFTFPDPVFDVFLVYKFIATLQIYKHCNIRPRKIVLAGDSAGANLMLSATALAMKIDLPRPNGIFLAYPACDLRSIYSPSRIKSFTDAILHPSLVLLCLKQYLGKRHKEVESNPLASPILLSQAFVRGNPKDGRWPQKWPPTRIVVGELDPLLDDSIRLCSRMSESGANVRCKVYRQLGHGFLSVQRIIKQGQKCIQDSVESLRQLLTVEL